MSFNCSFTNYLCCNCRLFVSWICTVYSITRRANWLLHATVRKIQAYSYIVCNVLLQFMVWLFTSFCIFYLQNLFSQVRASNGHNLHPSAPLVRSSLRIIATTQLITAAERRQDGYEETSAIMESLSMSTFMCCIFMLQIGLHVHKVLVLKCKFTCVEMLRHRACA